MANSDKNIVITPNRSSSTDQPKIAFTGQGNSTVTLRVLDDANNTLSFEGNVGQLFSISNSLTGNIFSVNDISGIPSVRVNSDGNVFLAELGGNVGVGNVAPTHKLSVTGTMNVSGNANVGNLGTAALVMTGALSGVTTLSVTGNANVGNLGTAGLITATGNVSGGNLTTTGLLSVTGNANVGNIGATRGVFTNISGTLETAAQTNITSVGTLTSLTVSGNAAFDTNTLFVDSVNNEVGIGTTSPLAILNTNAGTITGPAVTPGLMLTSFYSGVTAVNSIDWNYSGQSTSPVRLGATFNSDGAGMEMVFYTSTSYTTTGSERMRLNKDGNLGVGTASPGYRLHVVNSSDTSIAYYAIAKNDGGSADGFQIVDDRGFAGVNSGKTFRVVTRNDGTNDTGAIASFETIGGSTSTRMRINIDGNVGIGNSAPAHTLRVEGTLSATGNANVGNLDTSGNITANYFFGNGSQLTGITAAPSPTVVNGTSNLVVTANGNVTTSVAGTANVLVITSTGANVAGTVNVTGASYLATSSGNVGVGTASPGAKLTVIAGDSATASNQMILSGGRSLGAGADGSAGAILFTNSYWNSGYGAARISASDSGTSGGHLIFSTTANGGGVTGAPTEKMRILQNGNVGIGTSTPGALLSFGSGINDNKINLYEGTNDKYGFGVRANQLMIYSGAGGTGSGGITLGKFDGTTFTERMRVTNDGNVGIGNTAPTHTLRVEGTISATGNANVGNIGATSIVGTLTTASQTNITSLGTLGALTVSGNISIGSLGVAIDSSKNFYPGNQTTNYFTWDGYGISKVGGGYLYISNGTFYVQSTSVFRGVVSNDSATYLQINGGTSGHTYFNGNVGIFNSAPGSALAVTGTVTATTFSGSGASLTSIPNSATTATSANTASAIVARDASGNFSAGTITATLSGYASGAKFSNDSEGKDDISTRTESGFYQTNTATTGEGWPITSNNWYHLISCTHNNDSNYYAMQLAASFFGNELYVRSTNGSGTTAWSNVLLSSNYTTYVGNGTLTLAVSGTGLSGSASFTANQSGNTTFTVTSNATSANTGGAIVARDANGDFNGRYINASYFNSSDDVSTGTLTYLMGKFGDNYFRSATAAKVATFISGQTMNISGTATNITAYTINQSVGTGNAPTFAGLISTGQISARAGQSSGSIANATGGLGGVEIYGGGSTNAAFLTFHRPGAYAVYFGLDGTDLKVGGWSMGAVSYVMLNENNWTSYTSSKNVQLNSLGVGTAGSGTAGEIRATNNITAYYSDHRLKQNIALITDPLEKVSKISGVTFTQNSLAEIFGYHDYSQQVGVIAQEIQAVLPEAVTRAPFDIAEDGTSKSGENYLTVRYEKLVPLLIEAIKELSAKVKEMENK